MRHLNAYQWQRAITFAGQACECVDDCRRDHGNWWFATAGWRFAARDDVNVDCHRRIHDIGRSVAVEVSLLNHSLLQCDGAFRHELRQTKAEARLKLALDGEWIHGEAAVNRTRRAMNLRSFVLDRHTDCTSHARVERLVT